MESNQEITQEDPVYEHFLAERLGISALELSEDDIVGAINHSLNKQTPAEQAKIMLAAREDAVAELGGDTYQL